MAVVVHGLTRGPQHHVRPSVYRSVSRPAWHLWARYDPPSSPTQSRMNMELSGSAPSPQTFSDSDLPSSSNPSCPADGHHHSGRCLRPQYCPDVLMCDLKPDTQLADPGATDVLFSLCCLRTTCQPSASTTPSQFPPHTLMVKSPECPARPSSAAFFVTKDLD